MCPEVLAPVIVLRIFQYIRDPSIAELIAKAEPFLHGKACAFSADVVTKIDRLQGTRRETCHGIFIFKVPSHMEVGDYHGRVESLVDKLAELPVSQEHMVKYTIVRIRIQNEFNLTLLFSGSRTTL
jgi:hypothetical protein